MLLCGEDREWEIKSYLGLFGCLRHHSGKYFLEAEDPRRSTTSYKSQTPRDRAGSGEESVLEVEELCPQGSKKVKAE